MKGRIVGAAHTPRGVLCLVLVLGVVAVVASAGLTGGRTASASGDPVVVAAGDIACDPSNRDFNGGQGKNGACQQQATFDVLQQIDPAAVLALGDNQYYCGGYQAFLQSYALSWGNLLSKTYPSVGNHEYLTSGGTDCGKNAAGYFQYYAGAPEEGNVGQGWYSFDVGSWHLIALNSNCSSAGGCGVGSPQYTWLANDLAAHQSQCLLAYWHIPLFSSGGRANKNSHSFWNLLYAAHADVVLNGHDHIYERFAPQNPAGQLDTALGIREFIAGTGGANHTSILSPAPNSEVRIDTTFGVLELTLHPGSYDWSFVPVGNQPVMDSGSGTCHNVSGDTSPPSVPPGLSAAASGAGGVRLSWSPSTDDVGVAGYRVFMNGSEIGSTAATSYTVAGLACGKSHQFGAEAYDAAGNVSAQATVAGATAPCVPPPTMPKTVAVPVPATTAPPRVSGVAAVGKTLSTTTGAWNAAVSFAYRWQRCAAKRFGCAAIEGATGAGYTVVTADAGHRLRAVVSATNTAGTRSAASAATAGIVAVPNPMSVLRISGKAKVGRRLSAGHGRWSWSPTAYRYQWLRCSRSGVRCVSIKKATRARYRLTKRDTRHRLRVRITAFNAAGYGAAISRATKRVPTARG